MDSIPCSKRRRKKDAIDRISALPDALINHILSSLPTLDAVRTTVLSRRWNSQWTSIQNLDFDDGDDYFRTAHSDRDRFTRFVNCALLFRDSSDIQKFTVRFVKAHFRHEPNIVDWMCTAVRRNVVELRLEYIAGTSIQMPRSVFTCKTLRILTLRFIGRYITFDPPTSGCFPSLESLILTVIDPVEHEMEKLFSFCPKLDHLRVLILGSAAFNFKVSALELKQLEIISYSTPGTQLYVDAPKLENLDLVCSFPKPHLFLENAKSLVRATIVLIENEELVEEEHTSFPNRLNMLLAQISEVKYLSLSAPIPVGCCFPAFGNLTKLELVLYGCDYWKLLPVVLQKAPNLEYLDLKDKTEGDYECSCNLPEVVPLCLSSHLKSISIWAFKGRRFEMKVAEYLLKNGYHLNRFTISYTGVLDKKEELRKELFMFQRAITCSILFYE
ncbi:F-box/LRR-repeat protein [Rosa sericea]